MNRLLGHCAASNYPRPGRAFELWLHRTEDDAKCGSEMPLFARRPGGKSGSGLPVGCIGGKRQECLVLPGVSHINPASCSVTASGSIRRPAARRSSASATPPCGLRFPSSTDPP